MNHSVLRLSRVAALVLTGLCAVQAHAQFFDDRDARKAILELRQRLDAEKAASNASQLRLTEEVTRASEASNSLRGIVLDMQSQVEALRGEIARLRAQNDQVTRDFAESQKRQQAGLQGYEDRLRKLEPFKVSVDGREFMADAQEKREFEGGLALFRKGDFAGASAAFGDFVRRYQGSGFMPSARFWLGNAQYATQDYKNAVVNLKAMVAEAPDHPRAADAVLATANCQLELNDNAGARQSLQEVVRTYPQSEAAAQARDRLAKLK